MAFRAAHESVKLEEAGPPNSGRDERFRFGENWAKFLGHLTEDRIRAAEESLLEMVGREALEGKRFLDIGCGSGLFSLAAKRLGASVTSFDYDGDSVGCAQALKDRYYSRDSGWAIMRGSALDPDFMGRLGQFDVVYAWGVLHHTGDQWKAVDLAMSATGKHGMLFLALYNDQGWISRYWTAVKWLYVRLPIIRPFLIVFYAPYFLGVRWLLHRLKGQRTLGRGMSLWYDMIDWIGGWPFEVAAPRDVLARATLQGLETVRVKTVGRRQGCNEFVFARAHRGG